MTVNTQAEIVDEATGSVRTTVAGFLAVVAYTFPANCSGYVEVRTIARAVTAGGGAIGDTYTSKRSLAVKCIAGTLSQVGATNVIDTNNDASLASVTVLPSFAGAVLSWAVTSTFAGTLDYFAEMRIVID